MKRHLPFKAHLIWSAILLGVFGGFGIGGHLVYVLAFGYDPGKAFAAMIQVHGHLQLLGWTGFFIIGVSLYKLPRLMSTPPLPANVVRVIFFSLILGLLLKSTAQILLFYTSHDSTFRSLVTIGSLLESAGIFLYFAILFKNSITFRAQAGAYAAASLKPFFLVSLIGWFVYASINAAMGIDFYSSSSGVLSAGWNQIAIETYVHGVLLPTCFAFSISTFPIFLRLRAPTWPVSLVAMLYGAGVFLSISGASSELLWKLAISNSIVVTGVCFRTAAMLWLLIELDLFRIHLPWFRKFRENQDRENRPPRRHAGDYGQFGNFEWLIYAAYAWLCIGAVSELAALVFDSAPNFSVIRHFYLLGFVTHLILGMAVRIVPGFLGKNRVAYPNLVRLSFVLILLATFCRTLPGLFPSLGSGILRIGYGFSGLIGMLAIATLGVNLIVTVKQTKKPLTP